MDDLIESCGKFLDYPKNIVQPDLLSHSLHALHETLISQSTRLFSEKQASVDFLDLHDGPHWVQAPADPMRQVGFSATSVKDLPNLRLQLRDAFNEGNSDPKCRFIFLQAPHSRAALQISLSMLSFLFTYHQVMPSFLDFIFPFGEQVYPKDFYFSGFREGTRLSMRRVDTSIPRLGRSGTGLRMCYNLRSVERTGDKLNPWSIRQCALYHEFDVKTGRTLWIMVKGNKIMKNRIAEASKLPSMSQLDSRSEAFEASFVTHLLFCDWSGENWRWYINDLEEQLQALTRGILATPVDKNPDSVTLSIASESPRMIPRTRASSFSQPSRATTAQALDDSRIPEGHFFARARTTSFPSSEAPTLMESQQEYDTMSEKKPNALAGDGSKVRNNFSSLLHREKGLKLDHVRSWWRTESKEHSPFGSETRQLPLSVNGKPLPEELPPTVSGINNQGPQGSFTFANLQKIQYIEEQAQEALLVLNLNTEVLEELREHYKQVTEHHDFPNELRRDCEAEIRRFDSSVRAGKKDQCMLKSRTETLLQLLANRKNLHNGILQHRTAQGSEFLAREARASAASMESMTAGMHEIARKTKQETVSMRVITTVTLFFLPATFIATFMSTDILQYDDGKQNFQAKGLHMFLSLALPLTVVTFVAWYLIYFLTKKRDKFNVNSGANGSTNTAVV